MFTLETTSLTHRFANQERVLNDIHLQVEEQTIYGFLGPNGAGKTTTLKLVLGLLKKQEGIIRIFGKTFDQHRISLLGKIGSLIESPSLYAHLTAHENLEVLRKIYGCPRERIQEVLNLVGLPSTGTKKAGQFSLGMKQRLALAFALLPRPELLILDEPTNGLDPNGIIEMRELLKHLNREWQTTILISSHLLAEIERLVTHIGIIHRGKMMFQGTLDALKQKQQQSLSVVLDTSDPERTAALLRDYQEEPVIRDGKIVLPSIPKEKIAAINEKLVSERIQVYEIGVVKNDLESIFIDIVNQSR